MKTKLAIIVALVLALGFSFWQWRSEIRNAAQWAVGFEQIEQALVDTREAIDREREERERLEEQALRRAEELREIRRESQAMAAELRRLEETDEDYGDWAQERLPRALLVRERVFDGSDGGNENGD